MVSIRQGAAQTASNLGHPPFEWSVSLPRIFTRMINVVTSQLTTRREDGIHGMDHSINPRDSRDAEQHTYETRGSSGLVVQESKSDIK
jgi:hypothetical protein